MKLFPAIVTLHLLGGIVLLALLCRQALSYGQHGDTSPRADVSPGLYQFLVLTFALLIVQILMGGWVSTNYAVLACTDFPMCQNSWWPGMDFSQGFTIWRELGMTPDGQHIDFAALTAIHYAHRLMAYGVLLLLAALAWRMKRVQAWRRPARWLAALTLLQFLTGLSNVVLDWPIVAAVLHTGGAAALVVVLTWAFVIARLPAASPQSVSRLPA